MYVYVFASKDKVSNFKWEPESVKEMKLASVKVEKGMTQEQHKAIIENIMSQLFASEVIGMNIQEAQAESYKSNESKSNARARGPKAITEKGTGEENKK